MEVIDLDELKQRVEFLKKMKKLKWVGIILAAIAVIILILTIVASIYLDVVQLDEIGGLSAVYWRNFGYKAGSFAAGFLIYFLVILFTGFQIRKIVKKYSGDRELPEIKTAVVIPALIAGFMGAASLYNDFYIKFLRFIHATSFGTADPLFSKDISYYVFQRPFLMEIYEFLLFLTIIMLVYVIGYYVYAFLGRWQLNPREIVKHQPIVRHCFVNIALFIAVRIVSYQFSKEGLLYSEIVGNRGANYIDVNVWMRYFTIIPYLLILVIAASIFFLIKKDIKKAFITFAVYPAAYIVTVLIAAAMQFLIVNPNEYNLEKPYLEYNIKSTREAYGLDKIANYQFPDLKVLTPEVIRSNANIVDNIRVVDIDSTVRNNIQLQANTNFYSFYDGDILIYDINGKDTPVFSSAREVDQQKIPDKSYINTKYKYTHGYGVVMNSINKITSEGQVEYVLSGLRMQAADPSLVITQPRIYYGELTNEEVVVNAAGINEIDYDGNTETRYDGTGGITLSFLHRVLFAIRNHDLNFITSNYVKDATLLLNRNVVKRAQKAFPFLYVDPEAYNVIKDDGGLCFVMDGYTYSDQYPYSQQFNGVSYIRDSVKIVVDAYNGTTEYYIIDKNDPIIQTYSKIYPGVFKDEPLPPGLQKHIRYPEMLFNVQVQALKKYHLPETESATFYSQQDLWAIAKKQVSSQSDESVEIEPFYNLLMLPDEVGGQKEELILMLPFTPSGENKNNMVSWLAVRNNYENYGEMIMFEFPKNKNVFGPYQVEVKINQIDKISSDMTLWGQSGSDVYKGNLLVIPIEDSVLYVEPIYIRAAGTSAIPEVREIVVGYQDGDQFVYGIGANLDQALKDLFKLDNWGLDVEVGISGDGQPADGNGSGGATGQQSGQAGQSGGQSKPQTEQERQEMIEELNRKYNELQKNIDEIGALLEQLS